MVLYAVTKVLISMVDSLWPSFVRGLELVRYSRYVASEWVLGS